MGTKAKKTKTGLHKQAAAIFSILSKGEVRKVLRCKGGREPVLPCSQERTNCPLYPIKSIPTESVRFYIPLRCQGDINEFFFFRNQ